MKNHGHGSGFDCEPALRHDVVRACNRDRDDRHSAGYCKIKWSLLEREQLAVEGALAFHIDGHIEALLRDLFRSLYGFDASIAIAAVDGHKGPHPHGAAKNRKVE